MIRTGIDLIETGRIAESMKRERFRARVFSPAELALIGGSAQSAAARFCAKEAFGKALGTGVSGFALHEVQVLRDALGAPYLQLTGRALKKAAGLSFSVSLSHTKEYACAVVVAYAQEESKQ